MKTRIHEAVFDATNLSSGFYFYIVEAKDIDGIKYFNTKKKIMPKESLTMHEDTFHFGDYNFLLDLYKAIGFDRKVDAYNSILFSTWLISPSQAMAILNYNNIISKYYKEVTDQYRAIQYPERGTISFEHTFMLIRFYNVAVSWRKSQGINCPSNICNNLKIFNFN